MTAKTRSVQKSGWRRILLSSGIVVGCALVTVGVLGIVDYLRLQQGIDIPSNDTITAVIVAPSEHKPNGISNDYSVPANQPRVISIPSLDIEAYVQRVGVNEKKEMATPNNIYFTGWYVDSVSPGEDGVSIINGHVGGRYNAGIFKHLRNIATGAVIRVQRGDLSWREFEVISVKAYSVDDAVIALFNDDPGIDKELHLITCDGIFDGATQTYNQRVIVIARAKDA